LEVRMRTLATLATTTLLLLFLISAPAYPQDEAKPSQQQQDKDKDKQNEDKAAKPEKATKPQEPKPGQEQPATRPEDRKSEQPQVEERKHNDNRQPEAARPQEQRPTQDVDRGNHQRQAQDQRGRRIPDDKFRASFGRQHAFHVERARIVNNPQPIVVYSGYSFQLVDAWPVDWGFDDEVYVDYVDDGYYLFDLLHPGIRIAVIVVE
jgi:outer membrane biosynthesis protein TonB